MVVFIGIMLRLVRYLYNPSFYFDEANSAVDIIERSTPDLIHHISPDSISTYPSSFLFLTKVAIQLLGNTEYAFRLLPLLSGILSLFLFYYVAKKYIRSEVVSAALLLFAILDFPVYYSSILKPYSGDLFFSLLAIAALARYQSRDFSFFQTLMFAVTGAIIIWFSNPSVFVLAGLGTSMIIFGFIRKDWSRTGRAIAVSLVWAISFIIYYSVFLKNAAMNSAVDVDSVLKAEYAFFPFPPRSMSDLKWLVDTFFDTFNFADSFDFRQGLTLTGIGALLFISGCIRMYSIDKEKFITVISPVFFALAAAALHKYPFRGRLILFLTPFFLLVISEGVYFFYEKTKEQSKAIIVIIVIFLFTYPVSWAAYHVKKPIAREDIKPVLRYIKDNWQDGDVLYVHFYAQYAFDYYSKYHPKSYPFSENEYIIGIAPRNWYREWRKMDVSKYYDTGKTVTQSSSDILNEYVKDIDKLTGRKRVWLLFTGNISSTKGIRDDDFFCFYLDTKGRRLGSYQNADAAVYTYDLSNQPR